MIATYSIGEIPVSSLNKIHGILSFAKEQGIKEVHLLPYHTFGINKYHQMGIPYPMKVTEGLTNDDLNDYKKMGEDMGLYIKIGG